MGKPELGYEPSWRLRRRAAKRRPSLTPFVQLFGRSPDAADTEGALFRPISNNRTGELDNTITRTASTNS